MRPPVPPKKNVPPHAATAREPRPPAPAEARAGPSRGRRPDGKGRSLGRPDGERARRRREHDRP